MSNAIFCHRNRADSATLSGGSWETGQPLANLQDRFLFRSARSTDAALASTVIDVDLGAASVLRMMAIIGHNLSLAAQVKLQLRTATAGGGDLVAGHAAFVDAWPAMFAGSPARKPTAEEAEDLPRIVLLTLDQEYEARYLRIEISDAANQDGYVELGRLWGGPAWQPTRNYSYGCEVGYEDDTEVDESPAGVAFAGLVVKRRTMRLSFDYLGVDEGFQEAQDMARRLGKIGQALVCASPADADLNRLRMTMLATMEPSALALPKHGRAKMQFNLREVIG